MEGGSEDDINDLEKQTDKQAAEPEAPGSNQAQLGSTTGTAKETSAAAPKSPTSKKVYKKSLLKHHDYDKNKLNNFCSLL